MTQHQQMTHYCVCVQTGSSVNTLLDWYIMSVDLCPSRTALLIIRPPPPHIPNTHMNSTHTYASFCVPGFTLNESCFSFRLSCNMSSPPSPPHVLYPTGFFLYVGLAVLFSSTKQMLALDCFSFHESFFFIIIYLRKNFTSDQAAGLDSRGIVVRLPATAVSLF